MSARAKIKAAVACLVAFIFGWALFATQAAWGLNTGVSIGVGDTTFTVQGYTSPNAQVTIIDGSSVIGSVMADSLGAYSQQFTAQPPGLHSLQVYAKDRAGRTTGTATVQVNITEHAETKVDVFLSPTIRLHQATVTRGTPLSVSGEGTPGATLILYVSSTVVTTTIDSNGYWQYSVPTTALTPGQHQAFAVMQRPDGSQSHQTAGQTFIVLAAGGLSALPLPVAAVRVPGAPVILQPAPGSLMTSPSTLVSGIAERGAMVEVWNNGKLVGATFADDSGRWQLSIVLRASVNELKARACADTLCGGFSEVITVLFQAPYKAYLQLLLVNYAYGVGVGELVTLHTRVTYGEPPYMFEIDWGDGTKKTYTSSASEPDFRHRYLAAGNYKGRVTITDQKRESLELSFAARVAPSWTSATVLYPVLFIGIVIGLVIRWVKSKQRS